MSSLTITIFVVIKSPTSKSSLLLAIALTRSVTVNTPTALPSSITGAPLISLNAKTSAASFKVELTFKDTTSRLAISPTVFLGILLIVVVSTSKILSISSLPTILPITPKLLTGVGPILMVSPKLKSLMFPKTLIAASHSPGCGILVNSIFATEISFNFSPSL